MEAFTVHFLAASAGRQSAELVDVAVIRAAGLDEAESIAAEALGRTAGAVGFRILDEHDRPVLQAR